MHQKKYIDAPSEIHRCTFRNTQMRHQKCIESPPEIHRCTTRSFWNSNNITVTSVRLKKFYRGYLSAIICLTINAHTRWLIMFSIILICAHSFQVYMPCLNVKFVLQVSFFMVDTTCTLEIYIYAPPKMHRCTPQNT